MGLDEPRSLFLDFVSMGWCVARSYAARKPTLTGHFLSCGEERQGPWRPMLLGAW